MSLLCTELLSQEELELSIDFEITKESYPKRPVFGINNHFGSLYHRFGNYFFQKEFTVCHKRQQFIRKSVLSLFDLSTVVLLKNLSSNVKSSCNIFGNSKVNGLTLTLEELQNHPVRFLLTAYCTHKHLKPINPSIVYIYS